jgi:hypothetical protein
MSEGVISARMIRYPRKRRNCDQCGADMRMLPCVRLYGCAFEGDPLYTLYICRRCAGESGDAKVRKANDA